MNIGSIVSTVQSEPMELVELPLGEEIVPLTLVSEYLEEKRQTYEVLVNEEITPEIKEDIFA